MYYLALGDSISIDDYTGVAGGGAVSQFARLIAATQVQDLTCDGCTTDGVLAALQLVAVAPDIVTLTAGGNDFIQATFQTTAPLSQTPLESRIAQGLPRTQDILANLQQIASQLARWHCPVILNTIYDPTDGSDSLAAELGIPPSFRAVFQQMNNGIRELAGQQSFLLSDLEYVEKVVFLALSKFFL